MQKDQNVPMPEPRIQGSNKRLLMDMKVGESIFFEGKTSAYVSQRFYNAAKSLGMRISTKKEGNGTRMWRVQ